ncbi:nucleotidyl transferase family protein [Halostella salina]|uniref:hypothetical protein n=1 Tax=Halostella salina TaxID=1547897 RepID=UPI000EF7FE8B|nr:hypothetical protein [Halostella salina]
MTELEAHYEAAVERRGYDRVDGPFGDLSASYSRERFAFADDADALAAASPEDTLVSVGVSPTGTPHVGTLGQIRTAIDCQRAGFDVQLAVADQVVYNAGGGDAATLRERAERYRRFAAARGFDADDGRLYVQSEADDVLRAAFRLGRTYDPDAGEEWDESTAFEESLATAYDDADDPSDDRDDTPDDSPDATDFSGSLCGLLMAADTVGPLADDFGPERTYDRVVLALGADNVGMARRFDAVRERAGVDGRVVGLFSRLVPGVDGTPKMSKGIDGSGIHLGMSPDRIRERVTDPVLDADRPSESVVFEMLRLVPPGDGDAPGNLRDACAAGDARWRDAVDECADHLAAAAEAWQGTASIRPDGPEATR